MEGEIWFSGFASHFQFSGMIFCSHCRWLLCLLARLVCRTWALDQASPNCHAEHSLHLSDPFTGKSTHLLQTCEKAKKTSIHFDFEVCLLMYRRLWHKVCFWTMSWWVSQSATSPPWQRNLRARGTAWLPSCRRPVWPLSSQREATSCWRMWHLSVSYCTFTPLYCCLQIVWPSTAW